MASSAKSCESLFSASSRESASHVYQRKPNPRGGMKNSGIRQPSMVANNSEIHQRVMSARNLRAKTFQNQLADAHTEIANLAHENRMLRTLHKRQTSALNKYESNNAELPQLLHSHAEELRVWQTKHRNLQANNKDLEQKLKQKEALILTLSDQNKHYSQLNKDRNLDERQKLQEKVRFLEQRIEEKDNDIKLMARKVQLESKNFRQQLLNEQKKSKELMLKLEKSRLEISGYRKLEEYTLGTDKVNPMSSGRRTKLSGVVEEPDKIDKLEKSLEMLDKAIEKNNHSELHALTDVLESESLYDFEKDDNEVGPKSAPGTPTKEQPIKFPGVRARAGVGLSKLTLPPATSPSKLGATSSTRSTLSHLVSAQSKSPLSKSPLIGKPSNNRLRAGAGAGTGAVMGVKNGSMKTGGSSIKRLDDDDNDPENDAEENANEISLVEYGSYLDPKDTPDDMLDDMLEEDEFAEGKNSIGSEDDESARAPRVKESVSSLRKQISDDYKERESFLKTFCRQASGNNMRDDPQMKKRNSIATGAASSNHLSGSRKHALLAAFKTIDDNKSQD
ncbi:GL16066 [Drosophila persimilis]|uniref:GL16066 n=1 Tax=Drosophila persimilis TaxID=7234 RepID=B4H5N5_DROPE|nr:GL16066 [Drosophila persimilis]